MNLFVNQRSSTGPVWSPDPFCFQWGPGSTPCHPQWKWDERRECLCVFFPHVSFGRARPSLTPSVPRPMIRNKLSTGPLQLRGQIDAVPSAQYHVPPSFGCPSVADRYHNHTSPLLSPAYWIKHPPSCPARLIRTQTLEGNRGLLRSWGVMGWTRKGWSDGGDRPEVLCPRMSNSLMILSNVQEGWMCCFLVLDKA